MQGDPKQLFSGTPQLVELSGEPARRTASAFADGGTLHGQFHDRVGGNPQHSPHCPRSLGPDNIRLTKHQLVGAQDSAPGDSALSGPPQESVSDDQIHQNHQTQVYISPCPYPNALALDALSIDWSSLPLAYGFPPMPILPKVLQKIRQSSVDIILVAPAWPTQSWFPDLLNLSMAAPLKIPVVPDLLSQTVQRKTWMHRNPGMYNYHAWMLSGIPSKREAFLRRLPTESQSHNDLLPDPSTMGSGENSVLGVVGRKRFRSRPLSL